MSYINPPTLTKAGVPSSTDDISKGYSIGTILINTSTNPDSTYICTDNTLNTAVWVLIT